MCQKYQIENPATASNKSRSKFLLRIMRTKVQRLFLLIEWVYDRVYDKLTPPITSPLTSPQERGVQICHTPDPEAPRTHLLILNPDLPSLKSLICSLSGFAKRNNVFCSSGFFAFHFYFSSYLLNQRNHKLKSKRFSISEVHAFRKSVSIIPYCK